MSEPKDGTILFPRIIQPETVPGAGIFTGPRPDSFVKNDDLPKKPEPTKIDLSQHGDDFEKMDLPSKKEIQAVENEKLRGIVEQQEAEIVDLKQEVERLRRELEEAKNPPVVFLTRGQKDHSINSDDPMQRTLQPVVPEETVATRVMTEQERRSFKNYLSGLVEDRDKKNKLKRLENIVNLEQFKGLAFTENGFSVNQMFELAIKGNVAVMSDFGEDLKFRDAFIGYLLGPDGNETPEEIIKNMDQLLRYAKFDDKTLRLESTLTLLTWACKHDMGNLEIFEYKITGIKAELDRAIHAKQTGTPLKQGVVLPDFFRGLM